MLWHATRFSRYVASRHSAIRCFGPAFVCGLWLVAGLPPLGSNSGHAQSASVTSGDGSVRGVRASQTAAAMPAQALIAGVDAKLEGDERSARFRIALSAPVSVTSEVLSQPMRIIVDMPEIAFQASTNAVRKGMLVTSFRAGLVSPGRSRIVFELGSPARVSAVQQISRGGNSGVTDMTIDFEPQTAADFGSAVAEGAERRARLALAPLQPVERTDDDKRSVVVIDPGHGGIDSGAVAQGGVVEKTLALAIALQLRTEIEAGGRARVIMTRSDDRFLGLSERVRIAREARADLFISLHADSLSAAQDVRGATIYTGSERATDAESARLAQKENAADALGGAESLQGGEEVMDILMDLAKRETRTMSGAAAARLVTEMSGAVRMHRIPQRAAGFKVLTAPDVPSVLIELGYLSSKNDIALLTSAEWQKTAAAAIARAVDGHFSSKLHVQRRGASISP